MQNNKKLFFPDCAFSVVRMVCLLDLQMSLSVYYVTFSVFSQWVSIELRCVSFHDVGGVSLGVGLPSVGK